MKLEDMTNKDLIAYCKEEGIDVNSKNVTKPTKAELLEAIQGFELTQVEPVDNLEDEGINDENDEFLRAVEETKPVQRAKGAKLTRAQKRKIQYNELMPLRRVLISTNADNQTKTNLEFITWGNGLIGHNTDRVVMNKPWHVREGALRNMEKAIITDSVQNEEMNRVDQVTKPAYNIQRLDPLTKEEIERIAKRQIIRDASIESLI